MSRLIDADKFEAFVIRTNGDEEFVNGVQYVLEKIDNAPTVKAIPIEKLEQIRAEIIKRDNSCYAYEFCADEILEIIDKAIKEQTDGHK